MDIVYSEYYKSLSGDVKERYEEKIRECGCDPYAIKKKDLSVSPKDFPEITLLDIGEYLVHSVSAFTKKKFSAYKSTEAYKHFESGFVLNIGSKKHDGYAILKGRVSSIEYKIVELKHCRNVRLWSGVRVVRSNSPHKAHSQFLVYTLTQILLKVKHGQKMNETPLHVWVLSNMNGKIYSSHCTCIAGLSETCSHVGAICFAISNLWESNEKVCK